MSIVELWIVFSRQTIKLPQLSHTRIDLISDHKHEIYLNEKLSTKLLVQAANKILSSRLRFWTVTSNHKI